VQLTCLIAVPGYRLAVSRTIFFVLKPNCFPYSRTSPQRDSSLFETASTESFCLVSRQTRTALPSKANLSLLLLPSIYIDSLLKYFPNVLTVGTAKSSKKKHVKDPDCNWKLFASPKATTCRWGVSLPGACVNEGRSSVLKRGGKVNGDQAIGTGTSTSTSSMYGQGSES
jgi:hypothetical protein